MGNESSVWPGVDKRTGKLLPELEPHLHGGINFLFVTVKLVSSEVLQRRRKARLFQARVDREGTAGYGA